MSTTSDPAACRPGATAGRLCSAAMRGKRNSMKVRAQRIVDFAGTDLDSGHAEKRLLPHVDKINIVAQVSRCCFTNIEREV
jgi:hypothetical protein